MPLMEVEIVGDLGTAARDGLAQRIADAAGVILGSDPQETWVRLRFLPIEQYAENGGTPVGVAPVFVSILRRRNPEDEALEREVTELTVSIAAACGRSAENVHVRYEAPAAGRQAFGGRLT
jgi:phenylpyruvate tautomerase PptA (4-oxalocrotonate tautomerase family)